MSTAGASASAVIRVPTVDPTPLPESANPRRAYIDFGFGFVSHFLTLGNNGCTVALVENNGRTTSTGGVTGAGFKPGVSGNPGGRPKGVASAVREVVGDDPYRLAVLLFEIAENPSARDADRIAATKELFDRGWGKTLSVAVVQDRESLETDEIAAEVRRIGAELRGELPKA
jgi:hypothetical protein